MTDRFKDFAINLQHVMIRTGVKPANIIIELSDKDWEEFENTLQIREEIREVLQSEGIFEHDYYGFTVRRAMAPD